MSIESMMVSKHLIFCHPLLLLPSIFPSIRIFSSDSALHIRWPKYWSFSISPSNEYSGLISINIDWFYLLAVQGTLKSLLQHHNWKASIFTTCNSLWSSSHIHTWLLEKLYLWLYRPCWQSDVLLFKKKTYFLLKDNCFTEFCCFLPNLNMNQP